MGEICFLICEYQNPKVIRQDQVIICVSTKVAAGGKIRRGPQIVSERLKRRKNAIDRMKIRKAEKGMHIRKSLEVRKENLRRSTEQIELHKDKIVQAEQEAEMEKLVQEQKKKTCKIAATEDNK